MPIRAWLPPQRQLLVAVVAVAIVSAGALAWLAWILVQQDAALERQYEADRLQQIADRTAAAIRVAVADLPARAVQGASSAGAETSGLFLVDLLPDGAALPPGARVLFVPGLAAAPGAAAPDFTAAEAQEFGGDPEGALRAYERAVSADSSPRRAAALARVARVQRKLGRHADALRTYDRLAALDPAQVDGLPASLVARVGRASAFEQTGAGDAVRDEAAALGRDLLTGRWPVTRAQFTFYRDQAATWLGAPLEPDQRDLARSDALEWAWEHVQTAQEPGYRAVRLASGPVVVGWSPSAGHVHVAICDATYLAALTSAAADGQPWAVRDGSGLTLAGDPGVKASAESRLFSDAEGNIWTAHIAAKSVAGTAGSPRRWMLLATVTLAALVLAAGWYFILRGMARERAARQAQSDFVAAVSHEFRSPLTSVSHVAEMLATGRVTDESRGRAYDVLVRDTDRLRLLVEQVLEFGRFEAGGPVVRLERADLADTVRGMAAEFQARVAQDGYAVEFEAPDVPAWALVDREALGLALWNLLDNAVKYSPDSRTIWVQVREEGGRIAIDVRDRGLGIPPGEIDGIFGQFVRGAEPKARRIRGTGIGLALVRRIAQAHGGDVTVTSEPGRGSTFTMHLRAADERT